MGHEELDPIRKGLLVACGILSVGVAFLGIVLPLLPTTPFVLLAAWCFARSSKRLHRWLREHRWFGEPLRSWEDHRAVPPRTKRWAMVLVAVTFPVAIYLAPLTEVQIGLGVLALIALFSLSRLPTLPRPAPG